MWQGPRFEKPWLGSLDISVLKGSSNESRSHRGCTTCLLDLYGTYNMRLLAENVPTLDSTNPLDATAIELSTIDASNCFAHLSFAGNFRTKQVDFTYTQNFSRGLFATIHCPSRSFTLNCIRYKDLSPDEPETPNKNNETWKTFLQQFDDLLLHHNIDVSSYKKTDFGDTTLLFGLTKNYEDTVVLDYFDATLQGGVLFPTGKKRDPNKIFSLPHGYNGHFAFSFACDCAFGLYEWFTMTSHFDVLLFKSKIKPMHIKTSWQQSGIIKLAKTDVKIRPGHTILAGFSFLADHVFQGFSFGLGYGFSYKGDDTITPCDKSQFDNTIINSDQMFKAWKRHTIHFLFTYDFTQKNARFGPRIGIFYNWNVGGKRIFKASTGGVNFGLDIDFSF